MIAHAKRLQVESAIAGLVANAEARHNPDDHIGPESEVDGVMKCEGCRDLLELKKGLNFRPILFHDEVNGRKVRRLEYRLKGEIPAEAMKSLDKIKDPGSAALIASIKVAIR